MANFKIIPYEKSHGDEIVTFGMNDKLMEIDASFTDNRLDTAIPGLSYTLLVDNNIILAGGIIPLWPGVAEGWVMSSKRVFDFKIKAAISVKKRLDSLCENNKIKRLQTSVKEKFLTGVRFAEFLGLKKEGLMLHYGLDGTNYYRMAKIYELHR
tara:strand:+ start:478 stop:939 length:462 start_codon:yes stop_codon:yes gene_type:complete